MFKAQILRRSFSLFRRGPSTAVLRAAAQDGHETIQIQRVRFKRRVFTQSRLTGFALSTITAYAFLRWLDEEIEVEEEATQLGTTVRRRNVKSGRTEDSATPEGREITDEVEEEDDEDDQGLLFLPTGFSRPKPKTFYKGSDPEWQEFVRLASDSQRLLGIRSELITIGRDLATKNPSYILRLGKINPDAGSVWIETRFPDGPPPEYERPGYELTEDLKFRKATQDVHDMHHKRLSNLLVPTAVATSLYDDSKRRADRSWQNLKYHLGWKDSPKPETAQELLTRLDAPPPSATSPASTTATPSTTAPSASTSDTQKRATSPGSSSSPPLGNPAYERFGIALPDPMKAPTLDLSQFRQAFRRQHKHILPQPPRGSFLVTGLIEIIGERAKMVMDVSAVYDPKIGRYVNLRAKVRSVTDLKQRPKGGR